jgi:hypothetical protein
MMNWIPNTLSLICLHTIVLSSVHALFSPFHPPPSSHPSVPLFRHLIPLPVCPHPPASPFIHPFIHPILPLTNPPNSLPPQGLQGPSCATNTHMRAFPPNMVSTAVRFPSLRDAVLGVRSSDSSARNSIRIRSPRSSSQADTGTGAGVGTGLAHSARYFSDVSLWWMPI